MNHPLVEIHPQKNEGSEKKEGHGNRPDAYCMDQPVVNDVQKGILEVVYPNPGCGHEALY
jgi:hypothetical protein